MSVTPQMKTKERLSEKETTISYRNMNTLLDIILGIDI